MKVRTPNHRVARINDALGIREFDDFPSDALEEEHLLAPSCHRAPIRISRLISSGTTQSWLENKVIWFNRQRFTGAHEYAHFVFHLLGERYPQDVAAFSWKHGLSEKLDIAVELINQAFPEAESVSVGMEQDPESDQRWIMVEAVVRGPAGDIRLRHREYVRRLLKLLPWPMSTLIRTTYTLA
jgi:hypothetical protein